MRRLNKSIKLEIVIMLLVAVLGSSFTIYNAVSLRDNINEQSMNYVNDINIELHNSINETIKRLSIELDSMTFGLNSYVTNYSGEDQIQRINYFLNNRIELLEFDSLVFIMNDHTIFHNEDEFDLLNLDIVKEAFQGNEGVLSQDGHILYAMPVLGLSKEINGVVVGIDDTSVIQEMIKPRAFDGQGISLIIDKETNIMVEPSDETFLNKFTDFFDTSGENLHKKYLPNGSLQVDFDDDRYILSYSKLDKFDWICVTLVPYDFISKTTNRVSNTIAAAAIVTSYALISIVIFYIYKSKKNTSMLRKLAYIDPITNGLNINAFKEYINKDLCKKDFSIILVNIKNFKLYNVDLGKRGGDVLLKSIYAILNTSVDGKGYVARYYADIFYIYLRTDDQKSILNFIADVNTKIKSEAEAYLKTNNIKMDFVINYGVSTVNKDKQLQLAFDEARMACRERQANEDGIPKFYNEDIHDTLERNQLLTSSFKDSIDNKDFKIYLQAKVNPYNHTIYGSEVLVRWIHPTYGFIAPNDFIPLLEDNGYITVLDFYMFEETCRELRNILDAGNVIHPVSINLSGAHFRDSDFPSKYYNIARKYDIPTKYLELELTETFFIQSDSVTVMQMNIKKLHEYGFKVAMDDFGSGISTLSMLGYLDIDILKIDKTLIDNIDNPKSLPILESISEVAHKLHITTVVEGVETDSQLDIIKKYHFDYVQGYIYSKPMNTQDFKTWYENF